LKKKEKKKRKAILPSCKTMWNAENKSVFLGENKKKPLKFSNFEGNFFEFVIFRPTWILKNKIN
jgi:hypothetical protein